jgi:hypothetical protein
MIYLPPQLEGYLHLVVLLAHLAKVLQRIPIMDGGVAVIKDRFQQPIPL